VTAALPGSLLLLAQAEIEGREKHDGVHEEQCRPVRLESINDSWIEQLATPPDGGGGEATLNANSDDDPLPEKERK
jgi:hypothetical protein